MNSYKPKLPIVKRANGRPAWQDAPPRKRQSIVDAERATDTIPQPRFMARLRSIFR